MNLPKHALQQPLITILFVLVFVFYPVGSGLSVSLQAQPLSSTDSYDAPPPNAPVPAGASPASQSCTLIVHVHGLRNRQGVVRMLVFTNKDGWPDEKSKAIRSASMPANGGTVTFTLNGLPAAVYAVSVLHDENENHKLDRDLFGRPKEGIGFSNNPRIGFSTPSWPSASVRVNSSSTEITIQAHYT